MPWRLLFLAGWEVHTMISTDVNPPQLSMYRVGIEWISYFCSSYLKMLDGKSFAFILGFYCLVSTCLREQNLNPQLFKIPSFWARGPRSAHKPLRRSAGFKWSSSWAAQYSVQYSHESFSIWLLGQNGLIFGHRAGRKRDVKKEKDKDTLWVRELNIKELVKSSYCWWLPLQSPRVLKASRKSSTSYSGRRIRRSFLDRWTEFSCSPSQALNDFSLFSTNVFQQ